MRIFLGVQFDHRTATTAVGQLAGGTRAPQSATTPQAGRPGFFGRCILRIGFRVPMFEVWGVGCRKYAQLASACAGECRTGLCLFRPCFLIVRFGGSSQSRCFDISESPGLRVESCMPPPLPSSYCMDALTITIYPQRLKLRSRPKNKEPDPTNLLPLPPNPHSPPRASSTEVDSLVPSPPCCSSLLLSYLSTHRP